MLKIWLYLILTFITLITYCFSCYEMFFIENTLFGNKILIFCSSFGINIWNSTQFIFFDIFELLYNILIYKNNYFYIIKAHDFIIKNNDFKFYSLIYIYNLEINGKVTKII